MSNDQTVDDINAIATFLAHEQISNLSQQKSVDCMVICASAILHQADRLFKFLEQNPSFTKVLVLCGGKGHSTQLMYDAVAANPRYAGLQHDVQGLAEARVLEKMLEHAFDESAIRSSGCTILVEDQSTNCGSNATETRKLLHDAGYQDFKRFIIVQDPTMALRTIASFTKAFDDLSELLTFLSCPFFIPRMETTLDEFSFAVPDVPESELWKTSRFLQLVMGEIPRLRDDATGYGPRGKGYISHVEIPAAVEQAWKRLTLVLDSRR